MRFELVKIFQGKGKTQGGPRENGNPKYPLNNLVTDDQCQEQRNGRVVAMTMGMDIPQSCTKNTAAERA